MNLAEEIERLIKERPHNAGEIKDKVNASYPEIFTCLRSLEKQNKAVYYFHENVLTYRSKGFWER